MELAGILLALVSAVVWGSGDFSGGVAARRDGPFTVLLLASLSGSLALSLLALVAGEGLPSGNTLLWGALAGASGAFGIAALYRGLSAGPAALVAPLAAVVGALVPLLFGLASPAPPDSLQLAGFIVALAGIWLVTRSPGGQGSGISSGVFLAVAAGVGFGGFFVLIAWVETGLIFSPLVVAKLAALGVALLLLKANGRSIPRLTSNPVAVLAGGLDAGGNIFYLLAIQFTRVDIAAVLSSMYPAVTVLLASLWLKERVSGGQWLGIAICLTAVALISG